MIDKNSRIRANSILMTPESANLDVNLPDRWGGISK